jgi:DNA-binding PadR family transcriptional regulator
MITQQLSEDHASDDSPVRRPLDAADPARYILLGLLLLKGSSHGYDLARTIAPGTVLGSVVHLGTSHLYALLAQLEREGLICGTLRGQGARPPRRVYDITAAGRAAVMHWVEEPVSRPREVLLDFPLKLYLAQQQDPARALELVHSQRDLFAAQLADLQSHLRPPGPIEQETFEDLLRDGRIRRIHSTLTWLDHCAAVLAAQARVP